MNQSLKPGNIKIAVIYKTKSGPWGGGNQFLKALSYAFRKKGMLAKPKFADIILFNSHHYLNEVARLKARYPGKLFVHRVDGPIQLIRNDKGITDKTIFQKNTELADVTVFQSQWSLKETEKLGYSFKRPVVITNAADPRLFFPAKNKFKLAEKSRINIVSSSWSTNERKGLNDYVFIDDHLDWNKYRFTFVGNIKATFKHIHHIPPMRSKKLAKTLRKHDMYLAPSINDPCSNALIEALSCGLPALYRNSGGHPELVGQGGVSYNGQKTLLQAMEKLVDHYEYFKRKIDKPDIFSIAEKYVDLIELTQY